MLRKVSWKCVIIIALCVIAVQIVLSPIVSPLSNTSPSQETTAADPFFTLTPKRMRNCWRYTPSPRVHFAVLTSITVSNSVWNNLQLNARRFHYGLSHHHSLEHLRHHLQSLPSHEVLVLSSSAAVLIGLPASSLEKAYFTSKHPLILCRDTISTSAQDFILIGLVSHIKAILSSDTGDTSSKFLDHLASLPNIWIDSEEHFTSILPVVSTQALHNLYQLDTNNLLIAKLSYSTQRPSSQLLRHQEIAIAQPSHQPPAMLQFSLSDTASRSLYNRLGRQSFKYSPHSNAFTILPPRSSYRVVITLTTMPPRLPYLNETLLSLLDQHIQADAIYLNVPNRYLNYDKPIDIPSALSHLPVIINRCEDYGPATKLIPTLELERDPNTIIIAVDDDMIYKPTLLLLLLKRHFNNPTMVYANAGQLIDVDGAFGPAVVRTAYKWNDNDYPVDIIEAFRGVVYRRDFFNLDELLPIPKECRYTDDIWFSAHLAAQNIPRVKLYEGWGDQATFSSNDAVSPLRAHNTEGVRRNDVCALLLLHVFKRSWRDSRDEVCSFEFSDFD